MGGPSSRHAASRRFTTPPVSAQPPVSSPSGDAHPLHRPTHPHIISMARPAAAALALVALAAAAAPGARAKEVDPWTKVVAGAAPWKNLSANIDAAVNNGGSPKVNGGGRRGQS